MTHVIGVLGGSGGVGSSTFAAALAEAGEPSLLVDLDVVGGGVDVLLGIEDVPGARWSGLHLAGGRLDPEVLLEGLPRWGRCPVLAADSDSLDPAAIAQVLDVAVAGGIRTVVVDLPRHQCAERAATLLRCDLVVLLTRSDAAGLVATHAVTAVLPELALGVVVRRGEVAPEHAAELVGVPLLGVLPQLDRREPRPESQRLPRAHARVADGVLGGLREPVPA